MFFKSHAVNVILKELKRSPSLCHPQTNFLNKTAIPKGQISLQGGEGGKKSGDDKKRKKWPIKCIFIPK